VDEVGILILDEDSATQSALRQMLDSEGWRVQSVPTAQQALTELTGGAWRLMIADVTMTGLDGVLFQTLRELGNAPATRHGRIPLRVLFLLPESAGSEAQKALEKARMPYALKPIHLHDLLDKVSDLLLEIGAIPTPIRRVKRDGKFAETKPLRDSRHDRRAGAGGRHTSMFAERGEYMMSEEEIAEFERQEEEEREKKKKPEHPKEL
jgi:CheY-like chemotaxis protein